MLIMLGFLVNLENNQHESHHFQKSIVKSLHTKQ